MRVDVISIFPQMFAAIAEAGITSRALGRDQWALHRWNPRDFVTDNYRRVDDKAYGGGPGMVMMADPLAVTLQAVRAEQGAGNGQPGPVILMSPQGQPLDHQTVASLVALPSMTVISGRYEAVDQRFIDRHVDQELCVGDFIVSGGELPAMMLIDAVVRLLPGVLDEQTTSEESFANDGLLDCPHYTRPERLAGDDVPAVLLSGNHQHIAHWRRQQALALTLRRRPDLIAAARSAGRLSATDEDWLSDLAAKKP